MRRILCWIFGHRSGYPVGHRSFNSDYPGQIESLWVEECPRCKKLYLSVKVLGLERIRF
jgi:hypothetical protein